MPGLLESRRDKIVDSWVRATLESYPPETVRFLAKERDRFSNPVGMAVATHLGPVFDTIVSGRAAEEAKADVDEIIRIRCVQDFPPSQAVSFVLQLKQVVRQVLGLEAGEGDQRVSLARFDAGVDAMALFAFDRFVVYRDRVWEVRVREVKRRVSTLIRMSRLSDTDLDPGMGVDRSRGLEPKTQRGGGR